MSTPVLSSSEVAEFNEIGYVLKKAYFDAEEVELLYNIAKADKAIASGAIERVDVEGFTTRLTVCNTLEDDMYSAIVRSHKMVDPMEQLLGGEVYHYHHKMMLKEPKVGGAWEWHQDYGYWYNNGCLFPHMASCLIGIDAATKANGCLQVIPGSHHMGRIEHGVVADQTGADLDRMEKILERMEVVYCELEPGDAFWFHGNVLHRSDANLSDDPRWSLICCYNAARNNPYKEHEHPLYSPLEKWPDSRIKEVGRAQWERMQSLVDS
jgi:ectoine hydroxylase